MNRQERTIPNNFTLRLTLDLAEYEGVQRPACDVCGQIYNLHQRFFRIDKAGDNLEVKFAPPETGFKGCERDSDMVVILTPELLAGVGIEFSPDFDFNAKQASSLFQLAFRLVEDENNRDGSKLIWRRVRAYLTRRYLHPGTTKECKSRGCERVKTVGPPKTILDWCAPLFVAMYGLGLSYSQIAKAIRLPAPESSVRVCVGNRVSNFSETDSEGLHLNKLNRGKLECQRTETLATPGITWDVKVKGDLDERTFNWLRKLTDKYHNNFQLVGDFKKALGRSNCYCIYGNAGGHWHSHSRLAALAWLADLPNDHRPVALSDGGCQSTYQEVDGWLVVDVEGDGITQMKGDPEDVKTLSD